MKKLSKRQWIIIGVVGAIAIWYLFLRKKNSKPKELVILPNKNENIDKSALIKDFWKSLENNPPKSQQEAEERAKSFGLTKQDIDNYKASLTNASNQTTSTTPIINTNNQSNNTVSISSNIDDARDTDAIGTKYRIVKNYKAMNISTMQDYPFEIGTVVYKREHKNGTVLNGQQALKLTWGVPSGTTNFKTYTYIFPTSYLKKIN